MNETLSTTSRPARDRSPFKTYRRHERLAHLLHVPRRPPGFRQRPELVRLDVGRDVEPSGKPPVRIFIGTEPAQHRAERVLIWSIMKVRDPSRIYEIHLMKDLEGFDRRQWKTGFTGYRYAIPALAGGEGRAIYNDADQIYLADPAELFDLEMGEAGQLSITEGETSVMLLDCKKMIEVWDIEDARTLTRRKPLHKPFRIKTNAVPHLWRPLPKEWNARDFEYEPSQSKLLHFTILHTQPWQPFPKQFKYEPHALGEIWHRMERAADAARFTIFTKARPSSRFREALSARKAVAAEEDPTGKEISQQFGAGTAVVRHRKAIDSLIQETGAQSLLLCAPRQSGTHRDTDVGEAESIEFCKLFRNLDLSCYDPLTGDSLGEKTYDGVVSIEPLTRCSDDDVPWVLDEMFALARRFVYVVAACNGFTGTRSGEGTPWLVQDADWWSSQMACAARRHAGVRWTLCAMNRRWLGTRTNVFTGEG